MVLRIEVLEVRVNLTDRNYDEIVCIHLRFTLENNYIYILYCLDQLRSDSMTEIVNGEWND